MFCTSLREYSFCSTLFKTALFSLFCKDLDPTLKNASRSSFYEDLFTLSFLLFVKKSSVFFGFFGQLLNSLSSEFFDTLLTIFEPLDCIFSFDTDLGNGSLWKQ